MHDEAQAEAFRNHAEHVPLDSDPCALLVPNPLRSPEADMKHVTGMGADMMAKDGKALCLIVIATDETEQISDGCAAQVYSVVALIASGATVAMTTIMARCVGSVTDAEGTLRGFMCTKASRPEFERQLREIEAKSTVAQMFQAFDVGDRFSVATTTALTADWLGSLRQPVGKPALGAVGPDADGRYRLHLTSSVNVEDLEIEVAGVDGTVLQIRPGDRDDLIALASEIARRDREARSDAELMRSGAVSLFIPVPTACCRMDGTRSQILSDETKLAAAVASLMETAGTNFALIMTLKDQGSSDQPHPPHDIIAATLSRDGVRFRPLDAPCIGAGLTLLLAHNLVSPSDTADALAAELKDAIAWHRAAMEEPVELAVEPRVNLMITGPWPDDIAAERAKIEQARSIARASARPVIIVSDVPGEPDLALRMLSAKGAHLSAAKVRWTKDGRIGIAFEFAAALRRILRQAFDTPTPDPSH